MTPFFYFDRRQADIAELPRGTRERRAIAMTEKKRAARAETLRVINDLGLHARSAAKLAKLAGEARGEVWITKDKDSADAASILDILTLACPKGTEIIVSIEDDHDCKILERITALIRSGFGE